MNAHYACNSLEHALSRRNFLAGTAAGAVGMLGFKDMLAPANATEIRRQDKRVLVIFLAGGVSQLESWDPKPGTPTGGPFQAIPTSVPGIHPAPQPHQPHLLRRQLQRLLQLAHGLAVQPGNGRNQP
jgi:hypothetical protein